MPASHTPTWLCFGLSGPVGRALLQRRLPGDPPLLGVSRQACGHTDGVRWIQACLPESPVSADLPAVVAIASLGPLDQFAQWFAAQQLAPQRVVALSSTSVVSKQASPDPAERDLAARLLAAEQRLQRDCDARGSALLLLRPTLIYGNGPDRSLSRVVALARRWRLLPLSRRARGLRMPVHADDLAAVVIDSLRAAEPRRGVYALPGGETLAFVEMLRRTLAVSAPQARVVEVPDVAFRLALAIARRLGLIAGATAGMLSRLDQDLLADASAARRDLGYAPRPFHPWSEKQDVAYRGDSAA
ncbi:MAG TPA: nucleoside-diphosphate sugar epimerase [Arenimonas sp.]|nr:nucleoside-diphosphate sugar epimerase [Arenimonas sp.]